MLTIPPPVPLNAEPEVIPIKVVFQDEHIIVVDKPAGMVVHPAPGHPHHTLVNALLAICPDLKGIGGYIRPGIVHRLDKDTSGLMMVAKTEPAHRSLSQQLKERQGKKRYLGLAKGKLLPSQGAIDAPVGRDQFHRKRMAVSPTGREARTTYNVLRYLPEQTYVEIIPETGRTHQIRVHLAHVGHALLGDHVYGERHPLLQRHFLHAHCLGFSHPATNKWIEFTSLLPDDLALVLSILETK